MGLRQVIHAYTQHAHSTRHQFFRSRPLAAVTGHPAHLAVMFGRQPALQVLLVLVQVNVTDADLGEAKLCSPGLYGLPQVVEVQLWWSVGHWVVLGPGLA